MPNRCQVVDPSVCQILHVYNRCVRRAFLCGVDSVSGRDFSHRRQWLQDRMEYLVSQFAFDVATFAIMSNHFHIVLRSRPDIVASWSNQEVALRNMRLQGKVWFRNDGTARKSADAEIRRIVGDPDELARIRRKLSDVSSLMSYFDEHIAKRGNQEDGVTGAFWEGTFHADLIEDEASLLACMTYVDLNPIRAMLAQTIEESDYTGAFERVHELRRYVALHPELAEVESSVPGSDDATVINHPQSDSLEWERLDHECTGWLAPIEYSATPDGLDAESTGRRPSRKGFLSMSLPKYLEILEWSGQMVREDKRGSIPLSIRSIFERLGLTSAGFLEAMLRYAKNKQAYFEATERAGKPETAFESRFAG